MRRLCGLSVAIVIALLLAGTSLAQAAPIAQQGTGQICVLAFNDQDANGVRGSDEPLLAGVSFTLADANGVKGSYKSDGSSEPYCFGSLAAGSYTVQARGTSGLEATTPGQWAISLANGAQFDVMYGAQPGSSTAKPAANNTSPTPASGTGMTTLGRIVLGVLGLVVLAAAGLLALTTLQRARNNR